MSLGGLTPTGFVAPSVQEIITDLNTSILTVVDAGLDLAPDQPIGQTIGIFAEKLAEVWELMSTVYNSLNPDAAEGNLLDNVSAITGTRRRSATYSKVVGTLNLNTGVTVNAGSVVAVAGQPTNTWVLQAPVTNSGGSAANFPGTFNSSLPGPFAANAGTLTVINTPAVGWNSITNATDAVQGIAQDTDAVLRAKRQAELAAAGSCTAPAILADVLEVPGVISAFIFENDTDLTDSSNLTPHAIRVVVWDGPAPAATNNSIAQAIWNNKPAGTQTNGVTFGIAVDTTGVFRIVYFDRAQQVPIYFSYTTTPSVLTTAQTAAVKAQVAAVGLAALGLGAEVVALAFKVQPLFIPGIIDVTAFTLGTGPAPVGTTNIAITPLQIATVNTTHILVNGL